MAVNFNKAGSAKAVLENTKKAEQEKAQVVALQYIRNENLIDNPKNGEDITMTLDLEESMKQNGFTDPMEVTDFGMTGGKYMILSGHRRRAAGVKVFGSEYAFPCIVRHFNTAQEVQNYTLMANSQRDSAKDPCLFCGRYKMHEEYLDSIGFKGSKREEIAKRLGISPQQADRYNAMNKIILPVWDMVRAEIVGMSSVMPMAKHSEPEQVEIHSIMQEALSNGANLTRDVVKSIVDGFRNRKKSWAEIAEPSTQKTEPVETGTKETTGPVDNTQGEEPEVSLTEVKEPADESRNDEVIIENDPVSAEYENAQQKNEEPEDKEDFVGPERHEPTPEEKQLKLGADIAKQLSKLDASLGGVWNVEDVQKARDLVLNMSSLVKVMVDEMYRVTEQWNMPEEFECGLADITEAVKQFTKK